MKRVIATIMAVVAGWGLGGLHSVRAQEAASANTTQESSTEEWLDRLESESEGSVQSSAPAEPAGAASEHADASAPAPPPEATPAPATAPEGVEPHTQVIPVAPKSKAETPPAPRVAAQRSIEEIVVTARRTEENLQDVPVAITALSGEALQREQINSAQDLQGRVPSLTIGTASQMRNTETPTIRGQGANFGATAGVVIYYGEVPLPADFPSNTQGGPGKFFDLANMQVLKGSQGTLFGRNTTGGALLLEPHKPENAFSGSLAAEGSSYSGRNYEGVINVPISDDTLLMRAGVKYFDRDGFTQEVSSGKNLDDKHFWTARLGLTWRPTDRIENYLLGTYTDSKDNGTGAVIQGFNREGLNYGLPVVIAGSAAGVNLGQVAATLIQLGVPPESVTDPANLGCAYFNAMAPSTNCGEDIVAEQQARGIREVHTSITPFDVIKTGGFIDQFSFELADELTLRNIASYSIFKHAFNWDADGSRAAMQDLGTPDGFNIADTSQTTEELQLQGAALEERLRYVVGGFYQRQKPEGPQGLYITALLFERPTRTIAITQESYAPYAQASYDLGGLFSSLEGLSFTGGLRYTTDQVEGSTSSDGETHSSDLKYTALTYTAGLDYKFGSNLVYGKISRGYKAGGFSATAVTASNYTFKPEYVLNYELGQKADFAIGEMPARVNAAVYYTDYTDMQRAGIDNNNGTIGSAIFTVGKAAVYGFELETTLEPSENFRLSANYAFTKGEYKEYKLAVNGANPQLDCTGELQPQGGVASLECAPFQATPRHQFSVTAGYTFPVDPSRGMIKASTTYAWTDDSYSSSYSLPETEPGSWLEAYGLLNANLSWNSAMASNFDLAVFGTNLLDEEYRVGNSNVWNLVYYRASIYGEPRIIGARIGYRWGN